MSVANGKLRLNRETVKALRVSTALRTGLFFSQSCKDHCVPDTTTGGGIIGDTQGGGDDSNGCRVGHGGVVIVTTPTGMPYREP